MMKRYLSLFLLLGLVVPFLGCSSKSLSRSQAKALIEASKEFQSRRAHTVGLPGCFGELGWTTGSPAQLTPEGKKLFALTFTGEFAFIAPLCPARIVEITSMTGNENTQTVGFTYEFKDLAPLVGKMRQCNGFAELHWLESDVEVNKGSATLVRYDDGWRVQRLN
jgi:hypothetical protein